jgi:hypothetical protein
MKNLNISGAGIKTIIAVIFLVLVSMRTFAQEKGDLKLGFHADPVISWFSTNIKNVKNDGARPGLNFGMTVNKFFSPNYSFSTGINIISAGGRLVSSDTVIMDFTNFDSEVLPGEPVIYKIQYVSIPLGIKMQSNEIGYISFFTDLGVDPKIVIGGKTDIPSLGIEGENAADELKTFNLSYHVTAGINYSLGGTTAMVFGLSYDNNFADITADTGDQPYDKTTHKILSFRIGVIF